MRWAHLAQTGPQPVGAVGELRQVAAYVPDTASEHRELVAASVDPLCGDWSVRF